MNKKAKQFIKYIKENMNKEAFAIKEVKDAMHTVLFYANVNLQEKKILQCLVVIDDSQDILLRLDLRSLSQVKKNEREKWLWRINELNKQYPVFKFYQDLMTKTIVWEMMYACHDKLFEPEILQSYLAWIVHYAPEILAKLDSPINREKIL